MNSNNYLQKASEAIGYIIETIKNKDTGYKVRAILNGAFYNIKKDLDSRPTKRDIEGLKTPYFKTLAELQAARPDASPGDKAWVGDPYPGTIWYFTNSNKWENTGKVPPAEEVNLADYAQKDKLEDLVSDYENHKNGVKAQKLMLFPAWVNGYWNNTGGIGNSDSWIRTELDITDYDILELLFADPLHYNAKTYFIDSNNSQVGEYIGSNQGVQFLIPKKAVKIRISNRIVDDNEIQGITDPIVSGIIESVEKFATEQFVELKTSLRNNKLCHMSFDDVHALWINLVENKDKYVSIFENPFLGWLKSMRDKYGIVCTLILDYTDYLKTYPVPQRFRKEFIENLHWLKLGFQAKNNKDYRLESYNTALADYNEFTEAIMDLFGTWEIIDRVIRNNYFHSNINVANGLRDAKCGAIGFLGCDDWSYNSEERIVNVYLTDDQSKILDKRDRWYDYLNDFWLFKTDFRFEQVVQRWGNIDNCMADYSSLNRANEAYDLIVFSHENYYPSLTEMMETFFSLAKSKGYRFDFPMNVILKN